MNKFSNTFLREVLQDKGYIRGPFGSALLRSELISSGIPVYEQQHAIRGAREFRFFIGEEKYLQLKRFSTLPGDLIISCSGTVGEISMISKDDPQGIISQALLILRTNPEVMIPSFLRYFLITRQGKHAITTASHGSVQVNIAPRKVVENIELPLPKIRDQKVISHILGTLDEKIELNKKTNETLEDIAKALFKSWFIDFDPVKAKVEGRSTGLSDEISDLFSSNLEDQNIGPIPEGWNWRRLGDLITLGKGVSYKGKFLSDSEGLPMINLGCFAGEGKFRDEKMKFYMGKHNDSHIANYGDILVANTDITQDRIILGSPIIMPKWKNHQKFLFSHHVFHLIPNEGKGDWSGFIFQSLLSKKFRHIAIGYATGTTVLSLPKDGIMEYQIAVPPRKLVSYYEKYFKNLYTRIENYSSQNLILLELRNTLLPKLISGEVKITDAEKMIEEIGI